MTKILHFGDDQIQTEYSALMSKVMSDGSGKIKFPINEPAEGKRKSQIQEYLEFYGGPACSISRSQLDDIVGTVEALKERGFASSTRPTRTTRRRPTGSARSPRTTRCCSSTRSSPTATRTAISSRSSRRRRRRPTVFFEIIERHGAKSFGEGNFKALFEAIEHEQALRGNL